MLELHRKERSRYITQTLLGGSMANSEDEVSFCPDNVNKNTDGIAFVLLAQVALQAWRDYY